VTITYALTEADLQAFYGYLKNESPEYKASQRHNRLVFVALSSVALYGLVFLMTRAMALPYPYLPLIVALGNGLYFALTKEVGGSKKMQNEISESVKKGGFKEFFLSRDIVLTEAGLRQVTDQGVQSWDWEELRALYTTPSHIFLAAPAEQHVVIPRRAFGTEPTEAVFLETLEP
jgi:hypothetical protein